MSLGVDGGNTIWYGQGTQLFALLNKTKDTFWNNRVESSTQNDSGKVLKPLKFYATFSE